MNRPLRSKKGCWTCRVRKKKCDERRPICGTCDSLTLYCHGYGPKPEWMDNGEKEKAMANDIKETVKTATRKGSSGRIRHEERDGLAAGFPRSRLAPKPLITSPVGATSSKDPPNVGYKEISQVNRSPRRATDLDTRQPVCSGMYECTKGLTLAGFRTTRREYIV